MTMFCQHQAAKLIDFQLSERIGAQPHAAMARNQALPAQMLQRLLPDQ